MPNIAGWNAVYFDVIDSTNLEAKRRANAREDMLLIAGEQTAGRGRLSRAWKCPAGAGLLFTQLFYPANVPAKDAGGAVFLSAAAMCISLRELTGENVLIKWPNDLVLGGGKICGMLAECGFRGDMCDWIALGTGLNLTDAALAPDLPYAASLKGALTGDEILNRYLPAFDELRKTWEKSGLAPIIELMRPLSATLGRQVRVNGEIARALDIGAGGELLIRGADGEIRPVLAGDVSVRGLTDYA